MVFIFVYIEGAALGKKKAPKASPKTATPSTQDTKPAITAAKTVEKESGSRSSTPSNEKSLKHKLGKVK